MALSNAGVGCLIGSNFVGALAYADDIVLLAPPATALRSMFAICDSYASEYRISFNAEKSKCLVIIASHCNKLRDQLKERESVVDNKSIEFVESFFHLGHLFKSNSDDCADIRKRRSNFIGQVNNVLCYVS